MKSKARLKVNCLLCLEANMKESACQDSTDHCAPKLLQANLPVAKIPKTPGTTHSSNKSLNSKQPLKRNSESQLMPIRSTK